jgi:heat shock protein HslJ
MLMVQKMWRAIWLVFLVVVLLALGTGCQMAEPDPTPSPTEAVATAEAAVEELVGAYSLAATAWDLDYFGPPEQPMPMLPDTRATVLYFWERYAGFDGCNWFLGVYEATAEGELSNMTPARTRNLCEPEDLYTQSGMFVTSLLNVIEYQFEGEQLIENTTDNQRLLTLNPAKPVPMPGTEWGLGFWWQADREQWAPVVPGSETTITFGEGGEASGSGGCNNYTVSYEGDLQIEKVMEATDTYAELPTLTFGPVASQMAACEEPEGIMDQEQGYFTVLTSTAYYFKLGGMLMFLDAQGNPLLVFGARN